MLRLKIILQSKLFIICSLAFIIIYVILFTKVIRYRSIYRDDEKSFTGIVLEKKIDGDKLSMLLKAKEKITVTYYFKSAEEKKDINAILELGSKITVLGSISSPLENTIPNTFNYKEYLYNKKIYKVFNANEIKFYDAKINIMYRIKNSFIKRASKYDAKGYMQAFILGDKSAIDSDAYNSFRINGVTHLFAVSGMHVSFLVATIIFLLNKLKIKEKYSNIIVILFLIFYMFLIGFSASIVRTALLYIFLLVNKRLKIGLKSVYVLYLVFILLLIINPFYIYDLGFLYSFLTSWGLILFSKKIKGGYITKLFKVSLIAFLFSLPITISNFYKFNLLTIFNNMIIVPFISLILFPFTLVVFIIPILEPILIFLFNILEYINYVLRLIKLEITVPKISFVFLGIYYFIIYLYYKWGYKSLGLLGSLFIIIKARPYTDMNAYVYFLDVGQGDSSLIISPQRKEIIMIDTGGLISYPKEEWQERNNKFNLANNIISFLNSLGLDYLDLLIITHGDIDHLGYAKDIMCEIKVKKIMVNNNKINNYEKELIQNKEIIKDSYLTKNIKINNLNFSVSDDENASSLVLYTKINHNSFLFMGDAPLEVEKEIINNYQLKSNFLHVGHHGSNTSSDYDFIKKVNPEYAIISSGRNNRYHHPSRETLDTLDILNIDYFNTQNTGTIKVIVKKDGRKKLVFCPP